MKKLITLCLIAFVMILGTESVIAQSKIEVNAKASEKTEALRKYIKFDNDQRDLVYEALKEYVQANVNLKKVTEDKNEVKAKIEKQLDDKIRSILTQEQYERYLTFEQ
jgi:flagellar basal body-associated protein FliL